MEKVKAKSHVSCWGAGGESSRNRQLHVKTSPCSQPCRGRRCLTLGSLYLSEPQCLAKDGLGGGLRTHSTGVHCRGYGEVSRAQFHCLIAKGVS